MKIFSTFSGIGGFERGIINAHYAAPTQPIEFVGYSEIDKYAISVYKKQFGTEVKNYGDITKIKTEELPDFDCLVGGFPCQAFSIAGKRQGFEDTRGTLFFELARILRAKQPRLFVFENVKGLLSHDGGRTVRVIVKTLTELGYDVQWQVLNSKDFGVPQNRERVIFAGHLRNSPRPQVFPISRTNSKDIQVIGEIPETVWPGRHESIRRVYDTNGVAPTIPTAQGGGVMPKVLTSSPKYGEGKREIQHGISDIVPTIRATQYKNSDNEPKILEDFYPDRVREFGIAPTLRSDRTGLKVKVTNASPRELGFKEISPSVLARDYKDPKVVAIPVLTPDRAEKRQNGRRMKEDGDPSFTLTAQDKHGVTDGLRIRRLTPLECERLQAFPDNWTKYGVNDKSEEVEISDTQRYKMCGNAVTTNVIQAVFERILK